jgi:predicted RNA-binding protein YlxR (DUF448 family)
MAKTGKAVGRGATATAKSRVGQAHPSRKHIPVRTCVACRQTGDKRTLVRLVRTPAAGIQVDVTGKLAGRGAYLCRDRSCWDQALRSQSLSRALKTTISTEELKALEAFAAALPKKPTEDTEPLAAKAS